ncbi:DUF1016 N-terminal domain-containing protein [Vibrio penaeicida]|uniref:DUF1016 N-terminal domain-containing protein n=1 Tax=Vibrio penaeicida TaxID=104609 RepID=UPI000CEA709F|nr:DUF1016 N-terminal domain-containing protein [Vibrio penaeicida]
MSWSHYSKLIVIENEQARLWYLKEASEKSWSVRALERQIGVLYYERLLVVQIKNNEKRCHETLVIY